jgi:hypothetical protein
MPLAPLLKDCPCCSGPAEFQWWGNNGVQTPVDERSHTVRCTKCGLETPHVRGRRGPRDPQVYTQAEARAIWNRRPRARLVQRTVVYGGSKSKMTPKKS